MYKILILLIGQRENVVNLGFFSIAKFRVPITSLKHVSFMMPEQCQTEESLFHGSITQAFKVLLRVQTEL